MFGVSLPEILLVCIVILIVLGPERLPEATRQVAKVLGQFRRQADLMRRELYNTMYVPTDDIRKDVGEIRDNLRAVKREMDDMLPNIPEELMTCEDKARLEEKRRREALHEDSSDASPDISSSKEGSNREKAIDEEEHHG